MEFCLKSLVHCVAVATPQGLFGKPHEGSHFVTLGCLYLIDFNFFDSLSLSQSIDCSDSHRDEHCLHHWLSPGPEGLVIKVIKRNKSHRPSDER